MKALDPSSLIEKAVMYLIAFAIVSGLLTGGALDAVGTVIGADVEHVTRVLQKLANIGAAGVVLVGAIVALSPRHRKLGFELVGGAALSIILANLGPAALTMFGQHVGAYGMRLLGSLGQ